MPEGYTKVTGTLRRPALETETEPVVVSNGLLKVFKVEKDLLVSNLNKLIYSDDEGRIEFYVLRDSIAYIWAQAERFDTKPNAGTPFTIPDVDEIDLDDLVPAANIVISAVTVGQVAEFQESVDTLQSQFDDLVGGAPGALDTLNELAAALGDDANFAATVTTSLANKQGLNAHLTAISGLSPSADNILQYKSGAWANRTPAQLKTDLALVKADVGLGSVTNDAQLKIASNLSDLGSPSAARTNLGLGTSDTPTFSALSLSNNLTLGSEKGVVFQTQGVPFAHHVASAVFNGVRDDVSYWGFNLVPGNPSARANTSEPQLKFGLEQHWFDGATKHWSEFNLDWMNADGVTLRRFQSFNVHRTTNLASWNFLSENFSLSSDTLDEYVKFTPAAGMRLRGFTLDSRALSGAGFTYPTFRSTTTNSRTELGVMPNGAPGSPSAAIALYGTDYAADTTNYERLVLYADLNRYRFAAEKGGTGSLRSLVFTNSAGNPSVEIELSSGLDALSSGGRTRLRGGSDSDGGGTYSHQIAFGYAGADIYRQYLRTRHGVTAATNAIDLLTSDGVSGNGIGTAVLGLTVTGTGVGVGKLDPAAQLHVVTGAAARKGLVVLGGAGAASTAGNVFEAQKSDGTAYFAVRYDGNVGIGTSNPTQKFVLAGAMLLSTAEPLYFELTGASYSQYDGSHWTQRSGLGVWRVNTATVLNALVVTQAGNVGLNVFSEFGGGAKVIGIGNATTAPTTNPTGGGVLYASGGGLFWRGSSGTVTQLALP